MAGRIGVPVSDVLGASKLTIDATIGLTGLVEAMHGNIARAPGILGSPHAQTSGITRAVYGGIRGAARIAGGGLDLLIKPLDLVVGQPESSPARDSLVAILNGVVGDHLTASGNPLAVVMRFHHAGRAIEPRKQALAEAIPAPTGRVAMLVHGLVLSHRSWDRKGHDHGAALARDLGYTPVYLNYNSGLNISTNGRLFAALLETLVEQWPVPVDDLVIIGHSMGGLVSRSAHHYGTEAGHDWPKRLSKLVFLGTPHHGAPLERGSQFLDMTLGKIPYTAALNRLGRIRSAGITDLRYGNLVDEDWQGRDRFEHAGDQRRGLKLPGDVDCYAIAAALGEESARIRNHLIGDGLVPLRSALGHHAEPHLDLGLPESRTWIGHGIGHLDLLSRRQVYEQIKRWIT